MPRGTFQSRLEGHNHGADGHKGVLEHGRLLRTVLDEREQRCHEAVADRRHAMLQTAHGGDQDTAQIALQLRPVVAVVEADELWHHRMERLLALEDVHKHRADVREAVGGAVGDRRGQGLVR